MIGFYCTMLRGDRVAWLAGPIETKEAAEARVPEARNAAIDVDGFAAFDAFGVTRLERPDAIVLPYGVLNKTLGMAHDKAELQPAYVQ